MTLPPALDPRREKIVLYVLMFVQLTVIMDFMIMMPLSSYLIPAFEIGTSHFGLLVSAYAFGAAASAVLASSVADRFDRRHALLFLYAGLLISTLGCAMADTYAGLLIARAVAGVFGGVLGSMTFAIVGDLIAPNRRGYAMGLVSMGFSLSAVMGVPVGLLLAAHFGWRAPFVVLTVACALVWVLAYRSLPAVREHMGGPALGLFASWAELLRVPNHWWAFAVTSLTMFAGFLVIPYLAPSLVSNVGLPAGDLVYVYAAGGAITLLSRPLMGWLTDRYRHANVLAVSVVLSCLPIILITQTLAYGLAGQLLIVALFFGLVSGRFIPASALVAGATESRLRGRMMAFNSAVQNMGSGLAAFVAGLIMTTGTQGELIHYDWVGYLSCFMGIFIILASRRVKAVS